MAKKGNAGSAKATSVHAVEERAAKVADALSLELVEVVLQKESRGKCLCIYVDKEGSLSLDDCERYHKQLQPLIADTALQGYEVIEDDAIKTREMLLALACETEKSAGDGTCGSCPVDSHFNVKGVGTVVLGSVIDGYFRKHDKMKVLPLNREVVLKSIQKHDVDADTGIKGDHVGLALRGIESDELDRGYVLTTDPSVKMIRKVEGQAQLIKYWRNPIKDGMVMHLGHWMQMVPCRVQSVSDNGDFHTPQLSLDLESDLIHKPGDKALMMYLEGGKLRVVGSITLP